MTNVFLFLIFISIVILLGFVFYSFLSKLSNHGKTIIKWKIALHNILQIEFESSHTDNVENEI